MNGAPAEPFVGTYFIGADWPFLNALTSGITGDPAARLSGTDPARYARETFAGWNEAGLPARQASFPGLPGEGFWQDVKLFLPGLLGGIVLLALGIWVMTRQK